MGESVTSILDSSVVSFIVDGAQQILGILTTPPLGVFISIGLVGSIAGVAFGILRNAKRN